MLSIGDLARETGVGVPTIRYYEQRGLLPEPARTRGNQRRYSANAAERLGFIKHARDLGLSLEAVTELLRLNDHPDQPCDGVDRIAEAHLADVRARIERLQSLERELARIAEGCKAGTVADCYVLKSLFDHSQCETEH